MTVSGNINRKVSTLLSGNEWKEHTDYVPTQLHKIVHDIKIHNQQQKDFWFWLLSSSGHFNIYTAWNQIRNKHTVFNWTGII